MKKTCVSDDEVTKRGLKINGIIETYREKHNTVEEQVNRKMFY